MCTPCSVSTCQCREVARANNAQTNHEEGNGYRYRSICERELLLYPLARPGHPPGQDVLAALGLSAGRVGR